MTPKHFAVLVLVILTFFIKVIPSRAQIDLYSRINDPRAIARLNNSDSGRLQFSADHGFWNKKIDADGYYILAEDSGAGVITHLWFANGVPDTLVFMKIYVDGQLLIQGIFDSLLVLRHGVLRPPLDTAYPGAYVADIQIPYKKQFKITLFSPDWNMFYAIGWRHISNPFILPSFGLNINTSDAKNQISAEEHVRTLRNPWIDSTNSVSVLLDTLMPKQALTILDRDGPAMIRSLELTPDRYDHTTLDSLWLRIYWDSNPTPAVNVPVGIFFCTQVSSIPVRSLFLLSDTTSGLSSYFPMPFSSHAHIELSNHSSKQVITTTHITYHSEPIDRSVYGYFYTQFSESDPTRYNVDHSVAHIHGKGRYVGLFLAIPGATSGVSLEGNPKFIVDSNRKYYIEYTGGEDYFNGGWWFGNRTFSSAFAGHTCFFQGFYRFHAHDAIDFNTSFDFNLQHGENNDNYEHYQTVAYYYKRTVPFWTERDTIRANEKWTVSGSGYPPYTKITASFDSTNTIFTTTANNSGEFTATMIVPVSWTLGRHLLSINGEESAEPVYVLASPSIRAIADFLPPVLKYRDTLPVTGAGFKPGEQISLYLDSIFVSDTTKPIKTGDDYRFFASMRTPNIADYHYHIVAQGDSGDRAVASDEVTVSRVLSYEFEDLIPFAHWTGGDCAWINLSMNWYATWSKQTIALYDPGSAGKQIAFKFYVPVNDTFNVRLFLSSSASYGKYSYAIDGAQQNIYDGYAKLDPPWFDPQPLDTINIGPIFFAKDTHTFVFTCLGKDSASTGYKLGADVVILTPTTKMSLPKGVWKDHVDSTTGKNGIAVTTDERSAPIFPNPVSNGVLSIDLSSFDSIPAGSEFIVTDVLGRTILTQRIFRLTTTSLCELKLGDIPCGRYVLHFIANTVNGPRDITASFIVFK
ncbi:MAG TPA: glycoside hydrolase family 172 protein [Candidatus Kapabacteria bacterium]|nr:glycoside hydrolase family 172 protein [Candidatus Kapabacteria bacterium]